MSETRKNHKRACYMDRNETEIGKRIGMGDKTGTGYMNRTR